MGRVTGACCVAMLSQTIHNPADLRIGFAGLAESPALLADTPSVGQGVAAPLYTSAIDPAFTMPSSLSSNSKPAMRGL